MPSDDIAAFAAQKAAEEEATKQDLRSEVRRLSKTLAREREQRIRLEETIMLAARAAFSSWEKPAIPKPTRDPRTRTEETCVAMCSDWHYGAVTPDYSREVCETRVGRYADKILSLAEIQRADHPVRAVRLWVLGDLVGGEQIFSGQEHEIDASLVEQSFGVGRLLSDLALRLAGGFDRVHVVCLPGNHGRIGGKAMPYSPDTNADRIAYLIAQERTREPRVTWQIARADQPGETGRIVVDTVGSYGCLLTHGDLFRGGGYGGLPWYQFWKKAMAWRDMSTAGQIPPFDDLACFPAGTTVVTAKGVIPIEQVKCGDLVLTHLGRWRPVLDVKTRDAATVTLIGQGHPSFTCTPEHPILTRKRLGTPGRFAEPKWRKAKDAVGTFWLSPNRTDPVPVIPPSWTDKRCRRFDVTEDLMYLAGRWVGDGYCGQNRVFIACSQEQAPILGQKLDEMGFGPHTVTAGPSPQVGINGKDLAAWLEGQFGKYAHGKTLPGWLLGCPREWRRRFIEGYLDADGHRDQQYAWTCSTVSRPLAVGLKILAQTLGWRVNLHFEKRAGREHSIMGRPVAQRDRWRLQFMETPARYPGTFVLEGANASRVKKAEKGPTVSVYNLTVVEDESFVADGIIVHNCGHWHRTSSIEIGTMTLRVCGTLQTYDPFSRETIAAATTPAQSLLFVHPDNGITAEYRVLLG